MWSSTLIDDMGLKILPAKSGEILLEIIMRRYENRSTMMTSTDPSKNGANCSAMYPPPARYSTACSITPRLSRSTGAATDSSQPPSSHQAESKPDNPPLKTSKTESKAAQGQLFWFLLCSGNRVDRLAASHEHYAPPVQVRIR